MNSEIIMKIAELRCRHGKTFDITVTGVSMLPTLKEGDEISVLKQEEYKTDDVIVFNYMNEGLIVHRIIAMRKGEYYCKGDNAKRIERVKGKNIIGKVISKSR